MKIKTKLRIIIIINIVAFAFLILFNLFLSEKEARLSEKASLISKLNLAIFETDQARNEYFLYKGERSKDRSYLIHEEIVSLLKKMPEKFTKQHERAVLDNITNFYNISAALFNKLVKLDESTPVDVAQKQEPRKRIISQMIVNGHSVYLETLTLREIVHEERRHTLARHNLYGNVTFGFLGIFVVFLISIALRGIARPFTKLYEGTEIIAKGNLDYKTDIRTSDEIGQLSLAFDKMTEHLKETIVSRDILDKEIEEHRKTGDAFLAEKNFSESILDSMPGVFYCYNDQLQFKRWNKNFERVSGYSAGELSKISPLDLFAGEGRQLVEERIKEVFAKGELSAETDFISKDGRKTPYFFTGIKVRLDNTDHLVGVGIDISHPKQAEEALKESEQKYRSIFENAVEGIFQSDPDGRITSANPALVITHGYDSEEELIKALSDIRTPLYVNPELRKKYLGLLHSQGIIENFEAEFYRKDGRKIQVCMNVRATRDSVGNILHFVGTMENITPRKLAEEELKQTLEKLRKSLIGTIQAMSLMVETRDPYTAGHQKRVSNLARIIAQEMGLSNDTVDAIRMAGIIHDIGKISVPAEILSKPGKLSDLEFSIIKVHAQSGYNILINVGLPYPIAEIVLQHHERLDGSGYPNGLKDDQILIGARIVSVADVVEAISSHRPYRPAYGMNAALEEIEKNKGILYDEKVVEACLKLFREKKFKFE